MKKAAVASVVFGLLGALLAVGGFVGYRVYQARQLRAQMDPMYLELAQAQLNGYVAQLEDITGQGGRDEIQKMVDSFPRTGSGISFGQRLSQREDGDAVVLTPRVSYVWSDSPAHKAGILPGDAVVAIDGDSTEIRCAKSDETCPSKSSMTFLAVAIAAADRTQTEFTVSRGGAILKKTVAPAPYGKDIHDALAPKVSGYFAQLDAVAPKVAALKGKLSAATDEQALRAVADEVESLVAEASAPFKEMSAYLKSRVVLPEEGESPQ